jgi:hypothetical protein
VPFYYLITEIYSFVTSIRRLCASTSNYLDDADLPPIDSDEEYEYHESIDELIEEA